MNQRQERGTFISAIMEAVGLGPRKRLNRSGVRYLGMSGAFGRGEVRHCSTWDFDYKLPRSAARRPINDFNDR